MEAIYNEPKFKRESDDNRKGSIKHSGRSRCDNGYYYIEYSDGKQDGLTFDRYQTAEQYLNHGNIATIKSNKNNSNVNYRLTCGNITSPKEGSPGSFSNPF